MKVLKYSAPRKAEIIEVDTPKPQGNQILSKSIYCNISAGTEMGFYRGTAPHLHSNIEPGWFFEERPNTITYPMQSNGEDVWWMGYANVSEVIEVGPGVKTIKPGDKIFAQTGHKTHQLLSENDVNKLPDHVNLEHATLTYLLDITFNGILDSGINLMDNVAVFGLGTLGQLLVQLAKKSGAKVFAIDALENRLNIAKESGADYIFDFTKEDVAKRIYKETQGKGADVVLEVSGSVKALNNALRAVAYNGKIITLSFYQDAAKDLYLGKEYHFKRPNIQSSHVLDINPALSHAWDFERRRATAIELVGNLNLEPLISHRFDFDDLPEALRIIDEDPASCNAITVKY